MTITLGDILTLILILGGLISSYVAIINKINNLESHFNKFEGYIKAKVESMEKDINCLWENHREIRKIIREVDK